MQLSDSVDLVCVDPANVNQIWPQARLLIKSAIEHTGLSDFDHIEAQVLSGDQLLWLAISDHIEAAATTHLVKTRGRPILIITACSGSQRERWMDLRHKVEAYAKAENCSRIRLYGRVGWQRVLKDYQVEYVIMEKVL